MMVGAFVCCNGLLGRPLVRPVPGAGPRASTRRFVHCGSAQARGDQPDESLV